MDDVKIWTTMTDRYHHGDLANALLDAVGEIVAERGVTGVTLREAARRAGVSHSAPAHHFGDKDGMMAAYAVQGWTMLSSALRESFMASDTAGHREQLVALGRGYLRFALDHPTHYEVMMRMMDDTEDPSSPVHLAGVDAFGPLALVVGRLVDDGIVPEERARYFASMLWGTVHGVAHLWLSDRLPHFYEDHSADEFIDGLLATIAAFVFGD